ncbi:DUF4112 domain-containing protein [Spartobacteria bacterium LR76]|nr:DUF4112 domain-containing protein [Spartobacteria bacterium LR76]
MQEEKKEFGLSLAGRRSRGIYERFMEAKPIETEVLPPESKSADPDLARLLAWILDDLFTIPGTKFRVGLDPIIGLIPGLGDSSSTAIASLLLVQALRAGVPKVVITRMAVNILINAGVGAIPGIGDVFSAWFKSNRKNYQLLQRHAGASRKNTVGDWIFLGAIIAIVVGTGLLMTFVALYIVTSLIGWIFRA